MSTGNGIERGAAEMVGVLMLISIFVVAAGVLAVMYFSTPLPGKSPAVNLIATNQSRIINLYHAGGDALSGDRLQILVDGTVRPFTGLGSDNTWSLGETLSYTVSDSDPMPTRVDVVYNNSATLGTGSFLLASLLLGTPTSVQQDVALHTITATAGTGGSISPSGAVILANGTSQTFTITPNSNYAISNVMVDGAPQGAVALYTFPTVTADHTIAASFAAVYASSFSINVTAGPGGTVTPGNMTVTSGANQTYTIAPVNSSYRIANVVVNGTYQQGPVSSFAFSNVTSNQTLYATFASNSSNGLIGNYYLGMTWTGPSVPEITNRIRFADDAETSLNGWQSDVLHWPIGYIGTDNLFSVWYTGLIKIDAADTYMFYLSSDDGSNLTIDGSPVINNMGDHSWTMVQNSVYPTPGYHNISVRMYENGGEAGVYLEYSNTTMARQFVTQLYHFNAPAPNFNATPTSGNAPLTVQFTDASLDATAWTWDFGDGSPVSYAQNASHTYTSIGSYNVTLTATNSFGSNSLRQNNYITVGSYLPGFSATYYHGQSWTDLAGMRTDPEIRYADAAGQAIGEPSDEVNWPIPMTGAGWDDNFSVTWDAYLRINASDTYTFSLRSDDGSYLWLDEAQLINNGGLHSATTVTGAKVLAPGYHHIVVEMYENTGQAVARLQYSNTTMPLQQVTDVWHVAVVYPPVAGFSGTPLTGNAPLPVSFTDASTNLPTSWSWTFGDGDTTNSTVQNPVHRYSNAGIYNVSLTATNAGGSGSTTKTNYVNISPALSAVSFTGTPTSGSIPLVVNFTDTSTNSPTSWLWSFGDGDTTNSTVQNPVHQYTAVGIYNVTLTATNAGGSNSTTRSGYISVNPVIVASATFGGTISPTGTTQVTYGTNQMFTMTNSTGYYLASVLVDGASTGITSNTTKTYTFTNVTASHTIAATFALNPVITTAPSAGGIISPPGSVSVTYGGSQTFTITPNSTYSITGVTVNGVSQGAITSYTFTNVTASQTIAATFAGRQFFNSTPGGGTWTVPPGETTVQYLVIGGGGGGGRYGAGGGAGGIQTGTLTVVPGASLTVTVGAGGTAGTNSGTGQGGSGGNSVFASITASGGGGGGSNYTTTSANRNGISGGSGGGSVGTGSAVGAGSQGFAGGLGITTATRFYGGGGGGGGAAGAAASGTTCGNGGVGYVSSISGSSATFAGGGGGGGYTGGTAGSGGSGGGGAGSVGGTAGSAGTANSGGGGGGGGSTGNGGAGGSGIIIITY